jgi:hypothetical protein
MASQNFVLPGRRTTQTSYAKSCLAKAFANSKSRFCNPRNIEYPWYGLWCQILMDLTSDRLRLLTIPQHLLYYIDPPEPKSDVSDEDEPNHEANTSIPSVASTTPLSSAKEIIPDFAIIRILFRWLNADGEKIWRNVKIQRAGVPLLTEIKRAGSRSATTLKFALWHLVVAQAEALLQAAYLFRMIPDQQSVVLLACTGHWWSCRIVSRDQVRHYGNDGDDDFLAEQDEEMEIDLDDDDDEMDCGIGDELSDDELSQLVEASVQPDRFSDDSSAGLLEPVVDEASLAIPSSKWTGAMRLDSRASNQMLFLIHRRLGQVIGDRTGAMG